ncbi:phosphatase PAP2 family protein [Poritiphilus flavus]|uniref:Phosphatase PAP2 family protein n=1 Tax=Poritiphilus flavus TaxID=2697053 RepID=A0A6L9E7H2_9FLAO|nr:phosphatase PAP2 family protein [Poritiphilus flavus]NAS10686.1 phosphatase PAP2 family protein [Poritiphilus flavus]
MRILLSTIFIFSFLIGIAQTDTIKQPKNLWQEFTYDIGNMFGGMGYSYSRPFHWKGKQWGHFGMITAGTAGLYFVDDEFEHWVNGFSGDAPDWLITYGTEYGSPENNYMLTGAVYLTGLFTKNEKLRRTGVLLISSASAAGLLQQVSKRIIGRARPRSGDSSDVFDPFHLDRVLNYDSFPSGHAMLAFTNAYVIAKQFKSPWVKAGLYAVGSIPGFVRIMDDYHWISDVAFGMAISVFIVEAIDRYLDKKYDQKYNDNSKKLSWDLNIGPGQVGVIMRF